MSLAKLLEEEAHLLLQELREHVLHQINKGNKPNPKIEEILTHLETHVGVPSPTPVEPSTLAVVQPTVTVDAPADTNTLIMSVTPATVPIEAPQTVAQEQSAANKAN
jgi:hypothetical protein